MQTNRCDVHTFALFLYSSADKEKTMGVKDTKAKEYLADNGRFADLCNVVLFHGVQMIRAEDLKERDSAEVLSVLGSEGKELQIQKLRDLLKQVVVKSYGSAYIMLVGIEAQADVHYAMPVKVMTYDVLNYGAQVKKAARNHRDERKHGTNAEFLSGFHKEDKLTPVITITVYLGTEKWDGPRKLSDMFREKDAWLKSLISDYKIHLVVPREMDDFSLFQTSLGAVLEVIKASEDKEAMRTLFATNPRYKAMDNESVLAINTFIGGNFPIAQEGGITNMCKALEDMRKEDIQTGIDVGVDLTKKVIRLNSLGCTPEKIAEEMKISKEKVMYILE